ncbi:eukaryotic translation initiation factor 4 gamma 2-like, partial [Diaphorina citri]|uniref:Eukaryotic translation initiation factor 4 gamma 2-like n=1 Tax=Diaphorina citri TaxID=121845 RepID=A0A1S4EIQ8_DIACI
ATTDAPTGQGGGFRVSGGRDNSNPLPSVQRWIPPSALRRDALTPENVQDATFRKVRELLNKLTPEKFDKLSDDLLQLDLNSSKILKGVILLIFEKALHETKYTSMYARLCKRLTEQAPNFEPPDESCTFKKHLLWVCKNEFENRSRATEAFGNLPLSPDDEDRRQLAKQKMLGNIKFIGELGKHEIVTESILHTCIQELLPKNRKVQTNKDVSENLECLCQIMKTCGRILDSEKGQGLMNQYFSRMKTVQTSTPHLPLRIRFMLQDVEDLRRNNWVPRQANNPEKPVPINQIIEEDHDPVNFILPHRNNGMKEYSSIYLYLY